MKHIVWTDTGPYPIAILAQQLRKDQLEKEYLKVLDHNATIALSLHKAPGKKKTPKKEIDEYIKELIPVLVEQGVEYVVCTDADYYKAMTKQAKAAAMIGYVVRDTTDQFNVVYTPNPGSVLYDPEPTREKILQSLKAMENHAMGQYVPVGQDIIKYADYPSTDDEIQAWLNKLLEMDCDLTADIEAFSLKPSKAGIGTITFSWNEHEGIAFAIDYEPIQGATAAPYGIQKYHPKRRRMLRDFLIKMQRNITWHNAGYDVTVLIYQLFMNDITDTHGLYDGLGVMLRNWDDTKLIAYLATNSCAGNALSLKEQAQEFAGNYAEAEIEDITKIPLDKLLKYNLIDGLSTWYVKNKRYPEMVQDQQEQIYKDIFKPALVDIIQMQLTGLPLNMKRVAEVKVILEADNKSAVDRIINNPLMPAFEAIRTQKWADAKNAKYKKKRVAPSDCDEEFNPNSGQQVQMLLYEVINLPVINYTDSKQPATDKDTLKALKNHTKNQDVINLLDAFLDLTAVSKILSSFIPAMEDAVLGKDGWHYLCGYFNLGGTVSGRLSSSNPNLQNLPATGSRYAKLIKSCFQAPPGWVFVGLDFASLEDRISALLTKDPNKLKVYTDGYDGHSLRAHSYFAEQMPDILIHEEGDAYKVTMDDGTVQLLHESHPDLKEFLKFATECHNED